MAAKKVFWTFFFILVAVAAVILAVRFFSGEENAWVCSNGQWVKQGKPTVAMPVIGCGGEENQTGENATSTGLANPASVNCVEKGGIVEMREDVAGGQYGMCVFSDGKQCEEWAMFRGECPVGGIVPKETSLTRPAADELVALGKINVEGSMPGTWFFEANAMAVVLDASGTLLGTGPLTAKGEWMTASSVPFSGTISFSPPMTGTGTLVIKNDNPSGLPENDKAESYVINFGTAIKVFFPNEKKTPGMPDCSKVFSVDRIIPKTSEVARAALEEMLKGPAEDEKIDGFLTTINPGVKIQKLTIADGTAKVDFDKRLEEAVGGSCRVSAIRSQIEETLKQFPTVKKVIISIDGRTDDILQP